MQIDYEIFSTLPGNTEGAIRKFASLRGELVLVTDSLVATQSDADNIVKNMENYYKMLHYDGFFEFREAIVQNCENGMSQITNTILYPEGGILCDLLLGNADLGWYFKVNVAEDIAKCINCLHSSNLLHCDLHSGKIGFDSEWKCKLMELTSLRTSNDIFSPEYMQMVGVHDALKYGSPEVILKSEYSGASDIFSFGLVIFEICTRTSTLSLLRHETAMDFDTDEVVTRMKQASNNKIPDSLCELIRQMLSSDPLDRPAIEDVLDWLGSLKMDLSAVDDPGAPMLPPLPFKPIRSSRRESQTLEKLGSLSISDPVHASAPPPSVVPGGDIHKDKSSPVRRSSMSSIVLDMNGNRVLIAVKSPHADPTLRGYLQIKVNNLPYYKKAFFFFKSGSLLWCKEDSLIGSEERLHYFDLINASITNHSENTGNPMISMNASGINKRKAHHWTSKNRDFVKIKFPSTEAFAAWSQVLLDEVQQIRCKLCFERVDISKDLLKDVQKNFHSIYCSSMCYQYNNALISNGLEAIRVEAPTRERDRGGDRDSLFLPSSPQGGLTPPLVSLRLDSSKSTVSKSRGFSLSLFQTEVDPDPPATPKLSMTGMKLDISQKLNYTVSDWLIEIGQEQLIPAFKHKNYDSMFQIIWCYLLDEDFSYLEISSQETKNALLASIDDLREYYYYQPRGMSCSSKAPLRY